MTAEWFHAVRRSRLRAGRCPGCGSRLHQGYGMMGGGLGAYEVCLSETCPDPHFQKWQDYEMGEPSPEPGQTTPGRSPADLRPGVPPP